jgi:hypothetical protein
MDPAPAPYLIRINGHLGAIVLATTVGRTRSLPAEDEALMTGAPCAR